MDRIGLALVTPLRICDVEGMGFFDRFRRKPQIRKGADLRARIDEQAAFLVQKGIYEYSRARAGHYAKVLLAERGFHEAVDQARWRAFPLGLAMVAELVEGILVKDRPAERSHINSSLRDLVMTIFDGYQTHTSLPVDEWTLLRGQLVSRLEGIGLHPVKRAMDVPEPYAELYFGLMPIHERLRGQDAPTTKSYLRVTACNIAEEFAQRLDVQAVVTDLFAHPVNAN